MRSGYSAATLKPALAPRVLDPTCRKRLGFADGVGLDQTGGNATLQHNGG